MKGRIGRGGAATVMATIVAVVTIPQAAEAKPTLLRGSGDRFSSAGEVPGEVLIGFRIELVRLARGIGVQAAIHRYERDPAVAFADPNYLRYSDLTLPTDALFA